MDRAERGDFQTPPDLAATVVAEAARGFRPRAVVEPTCGRGSILLAAADAFPEAERLIGAEIDPVHFAALREAVSLRSDRDRFDLIHGDFFDLDWDSILGGTPGPLLVTGNPPWVTSAQIGRMGGTNRPPRSAGGLKGLDAVTGRSNFDISEAIVGRGIEWIGRGSRRERGRLAMLCKSGVAAKAMEGIMKAGYPFQSAFVSGVDAREFFGAGVDASLLDLRADGSGGWSCGMMPFIGASVPDSVMSVRRGAAIFDLGKFSPLEFLFRPDGDPARRWRSGMKHDCRDVMELTMRDGTLFNGLGEEVEIEERCVMPLVKSSDLMNGRGHVGDTGRRVVVTQRRIGDPTDALAETAPRAWAYLESHADALDSRRSSVYARAPRFAVFGIGDYAFSPWKVAVSGFDADMNFRTAGPVGGVPAMLDDTAYFLPAASRGEADNLAGALNSGMCRDFLGSMVCNARKSKRPVTARLLSRLDVGALVRALE